MAVACMLVLFTACEDSETDITPDTGTTTEVTGDTNEEAADDYTFDNQITYIVLNGTSISVTGTGVTTVGAVATITAPGTYSVSGSLTNGQLVVDAATSDKVKVMLNGANIVSSANAPLYVKSADKVILYLTPGTENALADGSANEVDGTLYSAAKLSVWGDRKSVV